jgi:hypothetical protein
MVWLTEDRRRSKSVTLVITIHFLHTVRGQTRLVWGSRGLSLFYRQSGSGAELTASITHELLDRDGFWKKLDASQGM